MSLPTHITWSSENFRLQPVFNSLIRNSACRRPNPKPNASKLWALYESIMIVMWLIPYHNNPCLLNLKQKLTMPLHEDFSSHQLLESLYGYSILFWTLMIVANLPFWQLHPVNGEPYAPPTMMHHKAWIIASHTAITSILISLSIMSVSIWEQY